MAIKNKEKFNVLAIIGFVLALFYVIVSLILFFIPESFKSVLGFINILVFVSFPLSIILCIWALIQISKNQQRGKWLAITGLIIDSLIVIFIIFFLILFTLLSL